MAKPKLSVAQRKSLRKEIGARLSKKEVPAVIVKAISEKYKITSFTARWYLRTVVDSRPTRKSAKGKKVSVKPRAPKGKIKTPRKAKATRRVSSNGVLEAAIAKSVQRTSLAKRLYPKLQATLIRARDLRRQEAKIGKAARATELRAKKLETQIRQLTA